MGDLLGVQSVFDDNFFMWVRDGKIIMLWTIHVDDIMVLALAMWLAWSLSKMEKRFGTIKRHQLPFTHMGMSYQELSPRHLFIHQHVFTANLKKIDIATDRKHRLDSPCNDQETHDLRSVLCSLLWLCLTRQDIE